MVTFRDLPDSRDVVRGITVKVPTGTARCPDCGGPLAVETDVEILSPTTGETRVAPALADCLCGFTHEFTP